MVRHVFLWRVAEGHDKDKVVELLNTLSTRLTFIKSWDIGTHSAPPNNNGDPWDGALITDFESWEDLDRYSSDPFHSEVVQELLPMVAARAVVDWESDAS